MTSSPRRIAPLALVLLTLIGMLFLAAGSAIWLLMPPSKITARTQLYVSAIPPNILFPDDSPVNQEDFVRRQVYLIKDRFILTAALRSPGVAELRLVKEQTDPVQWLENEIRVETPNPEFIHISLSGDRPDELQKLVCAVTQSYLDNVVDKERNLRRKRLDELQRILNSYEQRSRESRQRLRAVQEQNGALNEKSMAIVQELALDDLRSVKSDLTQVRRELRQLHVEFGLHPDWVEQVWPRYAAILNALPGPGMPINHAVIALLHDDAHLLPQAARENRRQKWEKYTYLKELEQRLVSDATRLAEQTKEIRKQIPDLSEYKDEIDKNEKVIQRASEKIESMKVEQDAPSRVTLMNQDENKKPQAMLYPPNESNRQMMTRAAVLTGLGVVLLVFAVSQFPAHKGHDLVEHPSTPSSPE
jgi:hypothetical protein